MTSEQLNFASAIKLIKNGQTVQNVATQLLACLTTEEKLSMLTGPLSFWPGLRGLMGGSMNANPYRFSDLERLGIPGVRFCDGPRGVILAKATSFPVAIGRGATWDTNLEERVGAVLAAEARALGANMCGSVCINLPRHPAWGRAQETYGEDPIHLGEFGLAMTKGLQDNGVMATAKHFALNSMEDMRFHVDVEIDDVSMHEVFLPHFEMVVREGHALSMMSAYNKVNGEWCGHHDVLLNQILRDEWSFKYFVISDWVFGIRDGVKSLKAGMDLEAPFKQMRVNHEHDLNIGNITIEEVDRSVTRILMAQLELYSKRTTSDPDKSVVYSKKHRDLAREVAAKSMVLLKNDPVPGHEAVIESAKQPLLPINVSRLTTVAMIGRLADANNSGDWGSSYVSSPHIITPYEGVKAALTAHGVDVHLTPTDDINKATIAAQQSDIAIVVVGYSAHDEGENLNASTPMSLIPFPTLGQLIKDVPLILFQQIKERLGFLSSQGPSLGGKAGGDRKSVRLPPKNVDLIRAVTKANPRTIVVMVSSGAVIVDEWITDANTVLISWYSGCEGGDALADVLLGRVDTSGRLPFSVPKDENDLPSFNATATSVVYDKWFGQRLLDRNGVTARFPLGYGLSYTSFTISNLQITQPSPSASSSTHPTSESFTLTVSVTNTGARSGHHTVQVYGIPKPTPEDFPPRVLLGFAPVDLQPNETKTVTVRARIRPLMRWQSETKTWTPASKNVEIEVGSHAGDRTVWGDVKL